MMLDEQGRPMVPVHVCWNDIEAAVIISYLDAHGIEAHANSEVPHSILPVTVGILGKVRVLVRQDDSELVKKLAFEFWRRPGHLTWLTRLPQVE